MEEIKKRLADLFWDPEDGLRELRGILEDYADMVLAAEPYATRTADRIREAAHTISDLAFIEEIGG